MVVTLWVPIILIKVFILSFLFLQTISVTDFTSIYLIMVTKNFIDSPLHSLGTLLRYLYLLPLNNNRNNQNNLLITIYLSLKITESTFPFNLLYFRLAVFAYIGF